jgi:drug/metabolite transporter (DMT)-like permease
MLIQVAILAWIFLGKQMSEFGIAGLVLASSGIAFVNLRPRAQLLEDSRNCIGIVDTAEQLNMNG